MKLINKKVFKGKTYSDYKNEFEKYLDIYEDKCIHTEYFNGKDIEGIKVEVYEI